MRPPTRRRAAGARYPGSRAAIVALALLAAACADSEQATGPELDGATDPARDTSPATVQDEPTVDEEETGDADETADTGPDPSADTTQDPPGDAGQEPPAGVEQPFTRVEGVVTFRDWDGGGGSVTGWQQEVPRIEDVRITSTLDGTEQPSLWLPPEGPGDRPLLVVVHSWSSGYLQRISVPFAVWADAHGWAMVHPDFRGRNRTPEATGSDLAVQDVIDSIDFAIGQGGVDPDRVFLIGVSGGGHMTLLMSGRHPDRFTAAAAWVPIHDLVDWYEYNTASNDRYAREIRASCGGPPTTDDGAFLECRHRSPVAHLDAAAEADVPMVIAHGLDDRVVPPHHSLRAFNQLAEPEDRYAEEVVEAAEAGVLPDELLGVIEAPTHFDPELDPPVLHARRSGPVTLVLFEGGHDMAYHPGLAWFYELAGDRR
jgi:poly(3-hydroxybutyrate) depolymerase